MGEQAEEIVAIWCAFKKCSASKGVTKVLGWNRMCLVNLEAVDKRLNGRGQ